VCTTSGGGPVERLEADLDHLLAVDVAGLADETVRAELLALLTASNRLHAAITTRVAAFDARGLAEADGFRTAKGWLHGFGRLSAAAAAGLVHAGRVLRALPALATGVGRGEVSAEHVTKVSLLAGQIGLPAVADADAVLADAAGRLTPIELTRVCERIRGHIDPDGAEPDPTQLFDRRGLTLSALHGMVVLRGSSTPKAAPPCTPRWTR
jgi:hypothetical protein